MSKNRVMLVLMLPLALSLVFPMLLFAEQITHNGMTVDANMPAEGCISCHDGSVAHIVSYCTVLCDFSTSHSIFKTYPPPRKTTEFAPAAMVTAKGIRLQNGQVTCISCHNLRNPAQNHLAVDNAKSDLCRICHIKK